MNTIAKAGQLMCIDHGVYSDYQVIGFFVVLKDFDPRECLDAYLTEHSEQRYSFNSFNHHMFLGALIAQGLLLEIEYGTMFLGEYGSTAEFCFRPVGRQKTL